MKFKLALIFFSSLLFLFLLSLWLIFTCFVKWNQPSIDSLISSDHLFDLLIWLLNWLMEIESKWSSIDLFVCFKFSWMMMNQMSSSHSYFYSLTYSDLALLIDLIGDWLIDWLLRLVWNDWFHWFLISSFIDWSD